MQRKIDINKMKNQVWNTKKDPELFYINIVHFYKKRQPSHLAVQKSTALLLIYWIAKFVLWISASINYTPSAKIR